MTFGILLAACVVGACVAGASAWILFKRIDPIGGPDWAFTIITASMTLAPVLAVLAGLSLLRGYEARQVAITAFTLNTLAFVLGGTAISGLRTLAQ